MAETPNATVSCRNVWKIYGPKADEIVGTPDADLPRPRIDVVYYLRYDRRVKIGTSMRPRQRLASIRHDELLAFERGGRTVERRRHLEFAEAREGGEWFTLTAPLRAHIAGLSSGGSPWELYARWLSEALRP